MNQTQLNLLHKPNIQELIKALDLQVITPTNQEKTSATISARIDQWFEEFKNPIKPSLFRSNQELADYITKNRQQFGPAWCPF